MKLANCAEALRRHHFEVETVKDTTEAFAVLKAIAERERPEIVSFGDSETMHATGIVRVAARRRTLEAARRVRPRDELSRTVGDTPAGADVQPLHHGGQRHQHGRLAPLARQGGQPHRPGRVRAPQGGHRGRTQQDRRRPCEAEERIRTIAAPQNVARHPGFRTPCARTGVCSDCNSPDRVCNTRMEMLRCWPAGRVLVVLIDQELGL